MRKLILWSFIIATCADILTGIIMGVVYFLNHPPINWNLFRFGLFMGYLQEVILITPVLVFCKVFLLAKTSRFYYYLLLSILYCSLHLIIYRIIIPDTIYNLVLESLLIFGFDLLLNPRTSNNKTIKQFSH